MAHRMPRREKKVGNLYTNHQRGLDWTRTNMSVAHTLKDINTPEETQKRRVD